MRVQWLTFIPWLSLFSLIVFLSRLQLITVLFVTQCGKVRFFPTALPGELLLHQNTSCEGYGLMLKVGIAWNPPEKTDTLIRWLLREFKPIGRKPLLASTLSVQDPGVELSFSRVELLSTKSMFFQE